MLGVIEADGRRVGFGIYRDEICPFIPKIVAEQHIDVMCNVVNDHPKRRPFLEFRLRPRESPFFARCIGHNMRFDYPPITEACSIEDRNVPSLTVNRLGRQPTPPSGPERHGTMINLTGRDVTVLMKGCTFGCFRQVSIDTKREA